MNILAIIPARGGSKRIKNKNMVELAGKPLIWYTINEAKKSRYINKLILSTDDDKIIEIAKRYNIEIIKRPKELAKDDSPVIDAINHVLGSLKDYKPGIVVLLQPTSPLRTVEDIDGTIQLLLESNADSAETFCEVSEHPAQMFRVDNKNNAYPLDKENLPKVHQDLPILYRENGAVYVIKVSTFLRMNTLYGNNHKALIMPKERSIDIDDYFDLKLIEGLLKNEGN